MSEPLFDRVIVTGGTGFIGSHLARALIAEGRCPVIFARSPEKHTNDQCRCIELDLRDREAVSKALMAERPTLLFHLAGSRRADQSNSSDTLCLLEAARRVGVKRIIMVGSADEYGNQSGPLNEDMKLEPVSDYATSKAAASRAAQAMWENNDCPVVILRPFTVYGPGQPSGMFVAEAIACAVEEKPFRMSEGTQRRDLVFVSDVVCALIAAAQVPGIEGRVINVGSGQATALRDVAKLIWEISETNAPLLTGAREASAAELHDTWADITLARRLLAWEPEVDLETGLRVTIERAREMRRSRDV